MASSHVILGSQGAKHSYSPEERAGIVNQINKALTTDADLLKGTQYPFAKIPMDPNTDEVFQCVRDGIVLCKFLNVLTKDKPACVNFVHKAEMQEIHMRENLSKVIQAAGHLQGVSLTNIGPGDIYEAQAPHLVLGLLWQLVAFQLRKIVKEAFQIQEHSSVPVPVACASPSAAPVASPAPATSSASGSSESSNAVVEKLLMKWFNFHLEAAQIAPISNFDSDLKDSTKYLNLMAQLEPSKCSTQPVSEPDLKTRAKLMLGEADKIGCKQFLNEEDVVQGNSRMNFAFIANLFEKYPSMTRPEPPKQAEQQPAQAQIPPPASIPEPEPATQASVPQQMSTPAPQPAPPQPEPIPPPEPIQPVYHPEPYPPEPYPPAQYYQPPQIPYPPQPPQPQQPPQPNPAEEEVNKLTYELNLLPPTLIEKIPETLEFFCNAEHIHKNILSEIIIERLTFSVSCAGKTLYHSEEIVNSKSPVWKPFELKIVDLPKGENIYIDFAKEKAKKVTTRSKATIQVSEIKPDKGEVSIPILKPDAKEVGKFQISCRVAKQSEKKIPNPEWEKLNTALTEARDRLYSSQWAQPAQQWPPQQQWSGVFNPQQPYGNYPNAQGYPQQQSFASDPQAQPYPNQPAYPPSQQYPQYQYPQQNYPPYPGQQ